MEFELTCQYCGHKFIKNVYSQKAVVDEACVRCGDKNLEVRDVAKSKIDAYIGCKPFPKKENEEKTDNIVIGNWPYGFTGGD